MRRRASRALPRALSAAGARVVLVYCEASPLREEDPTPRSPIRVSAVSLHGEALFDHLVQTPHTLRPYEQEHLELTTQDLESGQALARVQDAFRSFCEGTAGQGPVVLATWGGWTHRWLQETQGDRECILLKGVWSNLSRKRIPELHVLAEQLELSLPKLPLKGRAGRRLAQTLALTQHMLSGSAC